MVLNTNRLSKICDNKELFSMLQQWAFIQKNGSYFCSKFLSTTLTKFSDLLVINYFHYYIIFLIVLIVGNGLVTILLLRGNKNMEI